MSQRDWPPPPLFRCLVCEVGGVAGPCWICGVPMVLGDVRMYQRSVPPDQNMFQAITSFAPKEPLEFKALDDLVPRVGDVF